MSKYYKAEDVINAIEDKIAEYIPTLLRMAIEHLPTIEVSEDCIDRTVLIKRWDEMSVRGRTEFDQEIMVAPSVVPKRSCYRCGLRADCEDSTVLTAERR